MKTIQLCYIIILCSISVFPNVSSQIVINEFSAANYTDAQDNYGEYEDYIELYNTGTGAVDLSGYYLSDKLTNLDKWEIPAGVSIAGNSHLLIWCDDRNEVAGANIHSNFKITQTKANEAVVLSDPNLQIIDFNDISQATQKNHSWARTTDGGSTWGIAANPSPGNPNNSVQAYYAAKPEISPAAGLFTSTTQVSISAPGPNLTIHYTLDGDEPTLFDPVYSSPISISQTTVVRAKAFSSDPNVPPGFIETNTYFINDSHTISVLSVSGSGMYDLLDGSWEAKPEGHFEYFDPSQNLIHETLGEYNKHGNDSWAYAQRGIDFIVRDEFGHDYAVHDQIFPNKTRTEFQRLILKAAANDNYPFENGGAHIRDSYVHTLSQRANMEMDERTSKSCILYLNGEYWGIYDIREKVDDNDFTQFYYNQGKKWIDFIKTWGNTWAEYGSIDDWNTLHNYIISNDMSIQSNYDYVESQLEVESLIDYIILNTHVVCSDWLNWNTAWWRGRNPGGEKQRWRYALWDMDATFGHYINYTGVPDTSPSADPCDPEELDSEGDPEGHVEMLTALYANDDFYNLYINRYADLNNSYFTCDYMEGLLDEMIGEITPEMPRQIEKWGGSMAQWASNVEDLRAFIQSRCTVIDTGIVDCYEVTGPFGITVNVEPAGSPNNVLVNTIIPLSYPFQGDYFGGTDMTLAAQPDASWYFNYWTVANHTFTPDEFAEAITMAIEMNDVVTAYFSEIPNPGQNSVTYDGCSGDNYSVVVNGVTYDESNPAGTETIVGGAASGADSIIVVALAFNSESIGNESYVGDEGDGYSVVVNGTTYDEANPSGTEVLVNSAGCDSTVTIDLAFDPVIPGQGSENYLGCQGDGYSVLVNGTTYNEANPTGTEIIPGGADNGLDSTVIVNLVFNPNTGDAISYSGTSGDGYSVIVNGTIYNETNATGTEIFQNSFGCDSTVTIDLTFVTLSCNPPFNFLEDIDYDHASLAWEGPDEAHEYIIRYRKEFETLWNETAQFSPMYNLFGLVPCSEYYFEVKTICDNGAESAYAQFSFETGCPVDAGNLPGTVAGVDIYPNPFKRNVVIDMILLESQHVEIEIFDIRGKLALRLDKGTLAAGKHIMGIDKMAEMSDGVYLVKMNIGTELLIRELVKVN